MGWKERVPSGHVDLTVKGQRLLDLGNSSRWRHLRASQSRALKIRIERSVCLKMHLECSAGKSNMRSEIDIGKCL